MLKRFLTPALFIAAIAGTAAVTTIATGQQQHEPPTAESAHQAAVVAQVAHATWVFENSGFHELDTALRERGAFTPGAAGSVQKARILVAATEWPEQFRAQAAEFVAIATRLEAAIRAEDVAAAAPEATALHDNYHDLGPAVYEWLNQLGGGTPSTGHGHN